MDYIENDKDAQEVLETAFDIMAPRFDALVTKITGVARREYKS